ncbi:hypothetical protein ACFQ1M_02040 [Sungkyunkwania multivorans]|uniref:Uncharacterized protein n=1 Tax=Sungkyunkwania multivorans TaxID=1173618 RepID=A0ABW3CVU0_9FLAO
MKNHYTYSLLLFASLLLFGCKKQHKDDHGGHTVSDTYTYDYAIKSFNQTNAPALQSFVHATHGKDWLLFAGRTNTVDSLLGGLHDLNGNYANTSFVKKSFNDSVFVYVADKTNPKRYAIHYNDVWTELNAACENGNIASEKYCTDLKGVDQDTFSALFINSNPLVTQDGGFLYVVGGYGSIGQQNTSKSYNTFNQVARFHIASMVKLVKGETLTDVEWATLFRLGQNKSLISTGAEIMKMYSKNSKGGVTTTFYLSGGHNFGTTAPNDNQKYVDAVYPFTVAAGDSLNLAISVQDAISDVEDPTLPIADENSIFRRRDGPVVPSMYWNDLNKTYEQSLTFYAGVFKPGEDLQAWNSAIYVHPDFANDRLYTHDTAYDQNNYNVYACANFVAFDSDTKLLHTFLLGGIGDGKYTPQSLSGFTNTGLHIALKTDSLKSSVVKRQDNIFGTTSNFYGAESVLIPSEGITKVKFAGVDSEMIDLKNVAFTKDSVLVGHIYGGIEAFQSNPGTYGKDNSAASNKIWEVYLTRKKSSTD